MKHIYIHCPCLPPEEYRLVLEKLCPESVKNITVYTHFPAGTTHKQVETLVEVQKAFSENRPARFQNHAIFAQAPYFSKPLRKALRKNSFSVELQVQKDQVVKLARLAKRLEKAGIGYKFRLDEREDQLGAYRLFASHGLHILFTDPQYTAQSPDHFDQWLYDPTAQGINTYCDIINMLVMESHSPNCRHASCFGSTFRVDRELNVYLCPFHLQERTKLGSLKDAADLDALLNCQAVADLLPAAVQKRQRCTTECSGFAYCQGGCLLEAGTHTDCAHYLATVERIRQRLLEVYRDGKLRQVNYIVRNAILNALAFGTAFFNQQP